ncbi:MULTISPECIES: FAD-dependent monooxygenase [unclassified Nocardiopsis]|uniref:FAD-dependent monooxygenase n=1 Tax=unclassified Nocardiopsis TaxID=2649073 RepID=UPI00135692AA|nr:MULTISPECIES: FAD-dependent monooxygenase [unclassified Nocardiopsis]
MNEDTEHPRILIVGAGPVGLVLACELLRCGVDVEIISKTKRESPHSRATILWPRILELLDRVGVAERLVTGGHYFDQMNYYSDKRRIGLIRFDRLRGVGYPFAITIPQWRTERILEDHLASLGGAVGYGRTFLGGAQDADGVTCRVADPDGRERTHRFDWVIGADGYNSTVREVFGFRFAGRSMRTRLAITDAELVGEATSSEVGYYLTRTGNMVLAPLGDGVFRVGASVPDGHEGDTADRAFFERLLRERVPGVHGLGAMRFSGIFTAHVRSADSYHRGRVFLVGDAAHAMSPSGAQGMNTGIQDAVNLGWKLAGVAGGRYRRHLLDTYDSERRPAVNEVAALSTRLARIGLYSTWSQTAIRDTAYRIGTATRLLENALAPRLAQLDTHYGRRGRGRRRLPTAGERLPLGWRPSSTTPSLAVERYTVLLWPGLQYQFDQWTAFVARIRDEVAGVTVTDLGGRPPGPLSDRFSEEPLALLVRPDGHLESLLRLGSGPAEHHVTELGRLVSQYTAETATPDPHPLPAAVGS